MDYRRLTKVELIDKITNLENKIKTQEVEQTNSPTEKDEGFNEEGWASLFDHVLNGSGFDLSGMNNEFINMMINNISVPVYFTNVDGVFLGCNVGFEQLINHTSEEIIGKSIFDIMPPEIAENEQSINDELIFNNTVMNYETILTDKFGNKKEVVTSKSIFKNFYGTIAGIVGIINDVTEKKQAERALIESERKLREANATKDKFFSIISHDLKSPFTELLGFSEVLFKSYNTLADEDRKEFIKEIYDSSRKTFKLLENLLMWSRSQRGEIELKPEKININDLADEIIELYRSIAGQKNIIITKKIDENVTAFADRNTITLVLRNLVNNAVKFTNQGGTIQIDGKPGNDKVEISVHDSGVGIPKEFLDKIFRPDFSNKKIRNSPNKGSGLGLVLCKEFVDKNSGEIWVESEFGKSTTFAFSLPV
ncbi:MAG: ATP-binding protein [bacterium]